MYYALFFLSGALAAKSYAIRADELPISTNDHHDALFIHGLDSGFSDALRSKNGATQIVEGLPHPLLPIGEDASSQCFVRDLYNVLFDNEYEASNAYIPLPVRYAILYPLLCLCAVLMVKGEEFVVPGLFLSGMLITMHIMMFFLFGLLEHCNPYFKMTMIPYVRELGCGFVGLCCVLAGLAAGTFTLKSWKSVMLIFGGCTSVVTWYALKAAAALYYGRTLIHSFMVEGVMVEGVRLTGPFVEGVMVAVSALVGIMVASILYYKKVDVRGFESLLVGALGFSHSLAAIMLLHGVLQPHLYYLVLLGAFTAGVAGTHAVRVSMRTNAYAPWESACRH